MSTQDAADSTTQAHDALLLGSCCSALATLVPVALYQTGAISRLPDPPMSVFASGRITMSEAAHPFGIPDGLLGLVSFSATLTLAILARRHRTARILLGVKLVLDGSAAVFNVGRQVFSFGKLCSWCTATAISAGIMVYAGREAVHDAFSEAAATGRRMGVGTAYSASSHSLVQYLERIGKQP